MNTMKRILALLLAVSTIFSLAACSSAQEKKDGKKATKPKNTKITKIAKTRNSVKLTWKKVSCTGYQVQKYDTAKKKWVTVKTVKGAKKTSFKITKLKKNTAYKFRVRAYKKTSGLKSYSAWAKKTVRTKK